MVHKFSVSFYVRSNYSNRDGMEPVISRINLDGKRLSIGSTGVKVMPGIRLGVIVSDPYIGIVHHLDPVKRTYLTDRELHAVIVKKLGTKRLERVRDVFVFACYTGMYYCEISRLKDDDVVESCGKKWINTHRKKNGQPVFVPLLDKPLKLIRKHRRMRSKQDDDSLFPLKSSTKTNEYLKEIAGVCGINKNLTFSVARYTFATLALMNGVPEETIAVMLGRLRYRFLQVRTPDDSRIRYTPLGHHPTSSLYTFPVV